MKTKQRHASKKIKPASNIVGREVSESLLLAADPKAWSKDILQLRAKRFIKLRKAKHLSISELRAVAWFALLPELSSAYPVFLNFGR
jgi:hypothetical protein